MRDWKWRRKDDWKRQRKEGSGPTKKERGLEPAERRKREWRESWGVGIGGEKRSVERRE